MSLSSPPTPPASLPSPPSSQPIANSRCLVTGASDPGSIGYACAFALIQAGALSVTIAGRNGDHVQAAVTRLQNEATTSTTVFGVVADLKEPDQMKSMVDEAARKMSASTTTETPTIDIVIVSGANGGSEYLGVSSTDPDSYRLLHTLSVISPMIVSHTAIETYRATSVVMVSSMAAETPWPDTAPYNTSKAAQNCLVQQLAFQYRTRARVNAVLAGCIHSIKLDIMAHKKGVSVPAYAALRATCHPMERNGTIEEVAQAVLFLANPQTSSFVTGVLLPVDGGLHLSNWWNKSHMLAEYQGK